MKSFLRNACSFLVAGTAAAGVYSLISLPFVFVLHFQGSKPKKSFFMHLFDLVSDLNWFPFYMFWTWIKKLEKIRIYPEEQRSEQFKLWVTPWMGDMLKITLIRAISCQIRRESDG